MSNDETQIRNILTAQAAALQAGDVKAMLSHYAPEVVSFTLAPPLRQQTDPHDPAPTERWIATFEAPPARTYTQVTVTAGAEVAFVTALTSLSATPKGSPEPFTLWHRTTIGLRKTNGQWLITHEHESVPFEMDGSFQASVNLKP
ncbi:YybH family protein [Paractinoplanes durhamensis]|uniref:Ketosteroid isomerase n=1 Tax=Paractinoplanes durhamensis TaxID=113563 RepID=A0ABQ3YXV3_9ACTN|nr:nuclear transport factor 2 family protein [Actinoplanes durhamensis]GIE02426.1 ketosteroid isomerase [Actinoplanes durhamensis]